MRSACGFVRLLPGCQRLEVAVDLFLVLGRRGVVRAGGEPVLGLPFLELRGQRRFGLFERRGDLPFHLLPLREVLLERLGPRRRKDHPLSLERASPAALAAWWRPRVAAGSAAREPRFISRFSSSCSRATSATPTARAALSLSRLATVARGARCCRLGALSALLAARLRPGCRPAEPRPAARAHPAGAIDHRADRAAPGSVRADPTACATHRRPTPIGGRELIGHSVERSSNFFLRLWSPIGRGRCGIS